MIYMHKKDTTDFSQGWVKKTIFDLLVITIFA
jgi:hypothetical protein